jgi:hypothetical protein
LVWEEHVRAEIYGHRALDFPHHGKAVIRAVWRKVKVPGHAEEVLNAAAALK